MEATLASETRPGRAGPTAPGPARGLLESRAEARPSLRNSNLTDRRPRPVGEIPPRRPSARPGLLHSQIIFAILSSACSSSCFKFRDHNALVSPRPAVSFNFETTHCPPAAYEAESAMPLELPSDTVGARGLRSALIRRISRHDESHGSCFIFFVAGKG